MQLTGYTELYLGKTLYQVDVNYRSKGSWNDNVYIAWESNKKQKTSFPISNEPKHNSTKTAYLVPGELQMFFQVVYS